MILNTGGLLLVVESSPQPGPQSGQDTPEHLLLLPDPRSVGVADLVRRHPHLHLDIEINQGLEDCLVRQPDVGPAIVPAVQPDDLPDVEAATLLKIKYFSVKLSDNLQMITWQESSRSSWLRTTTPLLKPIRQTGPVGGLWRWWRRSRRCVRAPWSSQCEGEPTLLLGTKLS